ncbi:MAG TPA: hypothetical protein VGF29_01700 [Hyphomicrobiaceae bacterium]
MPKPINRRRNMPKTTRCVLQYVAGGLGLAVLAGPLAAQNQDTIKLHVPVQLKSMLAATMSVTCSILHGTETLGTKWSGIYDIVNGEFDQVIEVDVHALGGQSFLGADGYSCDLKVTQSPGGLGVTPQQGTPSGKADFGIYKLAKPNAFFRVHAQGPLHGGKIVGGIIGPSKDLTIGPKPKQP